MSDSTSNGLLHGSKGDSLKKPGWLVAMLDEQQGSWTQGSPLKVEDFLHKYPTLVLDRESLLELLFQEITLQGLRGAPPDLKDYLARFPDLEAELRMHFEFRITPCREEAKGKPTMENTISSLEIRVTPQFPGYTVVSQVGQGTWGVVYQARSDKNGTLAAIKTTLPGITVSKRVLERFRLQGKVIAQLGHPNLVKVLELGETEGTPFLVSEFLDYPTLQDRFSEIPMPPRTACELAEGLAKGIHSVHEKFLLHGGIKPSKVFLTPQGPKLADFAWTPIREETAGEKSVAQIRYLAPEQLQAPQGNVNPASDVYSLGALFYLGMTGQPPFFASQWEETLGLKQKNQPILPRRLHADIPEELEAICMRCLEKNLELRFQSADEFARALRQVLGNASSPAKKKSFSRFAAAGVTLALLGTGGVYVTKHLAIVPLFSQASPPTSQNTPAIPAAPLAKGEIPALEKNPVSENLLPPPRAKGNDPAAWIRIAQAEFREKGFGPAEKVLDQALVEFPQSALLFRERALVKREQGKNQAALEDFTQASELDPHPQDFVEKGRILYFEKKYSDTLAPCQKALKLRPGYPPAYYLLAETMDQLGLSDDAIRLFDQILPKEAADPNLFLTRGFLFLKQENSAKALADFDQAIKLDPQQGSGYLGRGWVRIKANQIAEAAKDAELAGKFQRLESLERLHQLTSLWGSIHLKVSNQPELKDQWAKKSSDEIMKYLNTAMQFLPPSQRREYFQSFTFADAQISPLWALREFREWKEKAEKSWKDEK